MLNRSNRLLTQRQCKCFEKVSNLNKTTKKIEGKKHRQLLKHNTNSKSNNKNRKKSQLPSSVHCEHNRTQSNRI